MRKRINFIQKLAQLFAICEILFLSFNQGTLAGKHGTSSSESESSSDSEGEENIAFRRIKKSKIAHEDSSKPGTLDLNNVGIDKANVLQISMRIRDEGNSWVGIDFSDNNIENTGAWTLSESLARHPQITILNFSHNDIDDEGAKYLSALSHLKALDLSYNKIGDIGARALANLTKLGILNLAHNNISFEGFYDLSTKLGSAKNLKRVINVRGNPLSIQEHKDRIKHLLENDSISNMLYDRETKLVSQENSIGKIREESKEPTQNSETKNQSPSPTVTFPQEQTTPNPMQEDKLSLDTSYSQRMEQIKEKLTNNDVEGVGELIIFYREAGKNLKTYISEDDIQSLHDLGGRVFSANQSKNLGSIKSQEYRKTSFSADEFYRAIDFVL